MIRTRKIAAGVAVDLPNAIAGFRLVPYDGPAAFPRLVTSAEGSDLWVTDESWVSIDPGSRLTVQPQDWTQAINAAGDIPASLLNQDPEQWILFMADSIEDMLSPAIRKKKWFRIQNDADYSIQTNGPTPIIDTRPYEKIKVWVREKAGNNLRVVIQSTDSLRNNEIGNAPLNFVDVSNQAALIIFDQCAPQATSGTNDRADVTRIINAWSTFLYFAKTITGAPNARFEILGWM